MLRNKYEVIDSLCESITLIVKYSVAQDYLESQLHYSADYQLINTEAISASHEAMYMVMVS